MRKFIILIIILCTVSISYAQVNKLTNRSIYDYYDQSKTIQFIGTNYLITNFYKFVVMPPVDRQTGYRPGYWNIPTPFRSTFTNIYSGTNVSLDFPIAQTNIISVLGGRINPFPVNIYNVGSIDAAGINLACGPIYTNGVLLAAGISNILSPAAVGLILSGGSGSYSIGVGVTSDTNIIPPGTDFSFYVTNTGFAPYPYKYIVKYVGAVSKIVVIAGSDGIHSIDTRSGGVFNGSGALNNSLGNLDVKIYVEIPGANPSDTVKLYYDMAGSTPLSTSNLNPANNAPDGTVNKPRFVLMEKLTSADPYYAQAIKAGSNPDEIWVGTIYAADPEVEPGNMVNFVISLNDSAPIDNNGRPWQYMVKEYKEQKEESDTTICINTKFSPDDPEKKQFHLIFKLNRRCFVNVSVYNVRGERITVLQNGIMDIGKQFVRWSGRNDSGKPVSMGLYLVVLHSAEFGDVRKVLVIKR